ALFEFLRNDKLDAKQYAFAGNRPKDPFKWNQYGFTLGGPVWLPKIYKGTNRLFFMSNFEGFRERRTGRALFTVPSVKMRNGDFSEISAPIYDPLNRTQQFPGNVIQPDRIQRTSKKLLEFYPSPSLNPGLVPFNHEALRNRIVDKDQFIQRIDFVESSKSNWFGRYSWGDEIEIQPNLYLNGSKVLTHVNQWMLSNTRILSPSIVNEFRAGYNSFFNSKGTELANIRDVISELKIPGIAIQPPVAWGTPAIGISGFDGFGDSSEGPYANTNRIYQAIDNFSWTTGKHSVRTGLELRWDQYNQIGNQFSRGSFIFEPTATTRLGAAGTGNAFADFLLGYCKRCEASVSLATINFRAMSQYYYMDDTWKIHPKVSINYGLRYEFPPAWFDKSGKLVNIEVPFVDYTPNVADLSRHPTFVRMGTGDFYEGIPLRFDPRIKV